MSFNRNGAPASLLGFVEDQYSLLFKDPGDEYEITNHIPMKTNNSPNDNLVESLLFVSFMMTFSKKTRGKNIRNIVVVVSNSRTNPLMPFNFGRLFWAPNRAL